MSNNFYYPTRIVPIREDFITDTSERIYPVQVAIEFDHGLEEEIVLYRDLTGPYFEYGPIFSELIWNNLDFPSEETEKLENAIQNAVEFELAIGELVLNPLTQWKCDSCGELIEDESDGCLAYRTGYHKIWGTKIIDDLAIVHRDESCITDKFNVYYGLSRTDRLAKILLLQDQYSMQSPEKFNEILKRLTLPYYEQARFYIHEEVEDMDFDFYSRYHLKELILKNDLDILEKISSNVAIKIHAALLNNKLSLRAKGLIAYSLFYEERPFNEKILSEAFSDTIYQVRTGLKEINNYKNSESFIVDTRSVTASFDIPYKYGNYLRHQDELYQILDDRMLSWAAKAFALYFILLNDDSFHWSMLKRFCKDRDANIWDAQSDLVWNGYIKMSVND